MNKFAEYKKEYFNIDTLEDANGFATFAVSPPYVYVEDVYVVPDMRRKGVCANYLNAIARVAKENFGCTKLITTVNLEGTTPGNSMRAALSCGMEPVSASPKAIVFQREIT